MEHEAPLITLLAVGLVLAFLLGSLAWRLKLSPIVGYLLAGVMAGPFTPGFVGDLELAPQLAEVGVILLMFGVGLHFSVDDLLKVRRIAIPGAIVQISVATILGWGLSQVLGWSLVEGLVFGLTLSCASTVVLLRALEDQRLLDSNRGRIAVGWLIVEDLVMVLVLVLLPGLAAALAAAEGTVDTGALLASLAWTIGKVVAFVALMMLVGRKLIPWLLERVAGTGERELFTLSVLAIALGIAVGSASLFDVSYALGAFFAGMLLNESRLSHKAASDSLPMRDAFAVLFFVSVGMLFDPGVLLTHPLLVLATLLIIVLGKSLAAFLIVRAFGYPNSTALTISASLAQIGEFSFILAGLGVALSILPPLGRDLVLAGALLSVMINPMLFVALSRWQARRAQKEPVSPPAPEPAPGPPLPRDGHTILVGYGRVGRQVASLLRDENLPVSVIDNDADLVRQAHLDGFPALRGNAASAERLREMHPTGASSALLAIPHALEAGEVIGRLREANPAMIILARAHSDEEMRHLLAEGADGAVLAERELAYSMTEMILRARQ